MKIVNRAAFLAMPAGTVFAKYEPCVFDEPCVKGDSLTSCSDFGYQSLMNVEGRDDSEASDKLFKSEEFGESFSFDLDCQGRDGCFDEGQLFAVYERQDVEQLIARLQEALSESDLGQPS